jgi:protease IV
LFFAILDGVGFSFSLGWRAGPLGDVVGVVRIEGEISAGGVASANRIVPALQQAYESRNVKAVVISIDIPGGAPVEAERIYRAIDALKASEIKRPIVAVINNMGASAEYMIALHADKIYAGQYSLVGSVGAVLTGWDFSRAISRVDVAQRVYASGAYE